MTSVLEIGVFNSTVDTISLRSGGSSSPSFMFHMKSQPFTLDSTSAVISPSFTDPPEKPFLPAKQQNISSVHDFEEVPVS